MYEIAKYISEQNSDSNCTTIEHDSPVFNLTRAFSGESQRDVWNCENGDSNIKQSFDKMTQPNELSGVCPESTVYEENIIHKENLDTFYPEKNYSCALYNRGSEKISQFSFNRTAPQGWCTANQYELGCPVSFSYSNDACSYVKHPKTMFDLRKFTNRRHSESSNSGQSTPDSQSEIYGKNIHFKTKTTASKDWMPTSSYNGPYDAPNSCNYSTQALYDTPYVSSSTSHPPLLPDTSSYVTRSRYPLVHPYSSASSSRSGDFPKPLSMNSNYSNYISPSLRTYAGTANQVPNISRRRKRSACAVEDVTKKEIANVSEQKRLKTVNNALEHLKTRIPFEKQRHHKMSKLKVLQFAIEYIKELSNLLIAMDMQDAQRQQQPTTAIAISRPSCIYSEYNG